MAHAVSLFSALPPRFLIQACASPIVRASPLVFAGLGQVPLLVLHEEVEQGEEEVEFSGLACWWKRSFWVLAGRLSEQLYTRFHTLHCIFAL